jgi:hypothetical protein
MSPCCAGSVMVALIASIILMGMAKENRELSKYRSDHEIKEK